MKTLFVWIVCLVPALIALAQPTLVFTAPAPDSANSYGWGYWHYNPIECRLYRNSSTSFQIMTGLYSSTVAYTITKASNETGSILSYDCTGDGVSEALLTKTYTGTNTRYALRVVNPVTGATYLSLDDATHSYVACIPYDFDNDGNIELLIYRYPVPNPSNVSYQYLFYRTSGHTFAPEPGGPPTIPAAPTLLQNFPNPFNAGTRIQYDLSVPTTATISIFDINGRLVRSLPLPLQQAGHYDITWDGTSETGTKVASGAYFYQLSTPTSISNRQMILLR